MAVQSYTHATLQQVVKDIVAKEYPNAAKARLKAFADKVAAHAGCGLSSFTLDDDLRAMHIDFFKSQHPDLLRAVPSLDAVHAALLKKEAAKRLSDWPDDPVRQQVDPKWKIDKLREIQGWSDEQRFAVVPKGEPGAPAAPTKAAPAIDSVEGLDAEMFKRWGKSPATILAQDRRRFHDLLRDEQRREAQTNRDAALAHAGDFTNLSPAERISRHRAAEKAKS